jgi:hypothetical protein
MDKVSLGSHDLPPYIVISSKDVKEVVNPKHKALFKEMEKLN